MAELLGIYTEEKGKEWGDELITSVTATRRMGPPPAWQTMLKGRTTPFVLVWHSRLLPRDEPEIKARVTWSDLRKEYPHLAGIVFVKDHQFCNMSESEARALEQAYGDRLHVCSYAIKTVVKGDAVYSRFQRFSEEIKSLVDEQIPWHLLEPSPWPENLVSVYLLLLASGRIADHGFASEKERLLKTTIVLEAKREYEEIGGKDWKDPLAEPDACLSEIRQRFEEIAAKS